MTGAPAPPLEPIAYSPENTVVAGFVADPARAAGYQSEADLERAFIDLLREQAYEHLSSASEAELVANLRTQLEAPNRTRFSDVAWDRFFRERIAGDKDGVVEETIRIQEDAAERPHPVTLSERGHPT